MKGLKGLFIFAAGAVAGAIAGAYLVKDKVMADAKQEIDEVREYYKSKKETKKEEQPVKDNEEVKEETKVEVKEQYEEITRNYTNYNKMTDETPVAKPEAVVNDPYIIDPEEFGEDPGQDTVTLTYFADKVLVDDVDEVIDDIENTVGLENLKIFDEFSASAVYVRNEFMNIDFEILKDDWNWSDFQDKPVVEKKPHQL